MSETVETATNSENSTPIIAKKIGIPKEIFEGEAALPPRPIRRKNCKKWV
jgi:hypothetical protein